MPLLTESVNSPSMVYHCISFISQLTPKLNPLQPPVVSNNQLVYPIAKKVQRMPP